MKREIRLVALVDLVGEGAGASSVGLVSVGADSVTGSVEETGPVSSGTVAVASAFSPSFCSGRASVLLDASTASATAAAATGEEVVVVVVVVVVATGTSPTSTAAGVAAAAASVEV
ncbi:hypothetical protein BDF20DRAFT_896692 [Mycotypha africana]|uniref:uncharacterized protein n=1 Tax=Mycotypha africana TaxID=64632 RepID=UPI0022FFE8CC|nr:uncharacterized protein BDF20DRAFT_896692 [Mycotypha africana]KAI8968491.1 hypothetical protein BDF20DRAFT_896692 [Mycotypha africana]